MKGKADVLESPVARRLFFLFILSAFLPLAAIAALSLNQVRALLLESGEQRLAATAKAYGTAMYERLQVAADMAVSASLNPRGAASADSLHARMFSSLALVDVAGRTSWLFGDGPEVEVPGHARVRAAAGKPTLVVRRLNGVASFQLVAPGGSPVPGLVVGELRPAFLWGASTDHPAGIEFCVVEEASRRLLHCSAEGGQGAVDVLGVAGTEVAEGGAWRRNGRTMRARSWGQFLRAGFGAEDWMVVASQGEEELLERLVPFRQLYFPVVGLGIVLVLWFTFRQSRDIVVPVTQLAARARAIAANDFQSRLRMDRKDEFGELASAFDHMTERLGKEFETLTTLSELDRMILASRNTDDIARAAARGLSQLVAADLVCVTLLQARGAGRVRTFLAMPGEQDASPILGEMEAREVQAMRHESGVIRQIGTEATLGYLEPARTRGMAAVAVQPIAWRGDTCGAIVLGFRSNRVLPDDERRRIAEFADRLAVAVSSAWRDEQLYAQAHFDPLTGAPNRLLFTDRLEIEIARSRREDLTFALLFVDLDHFKNVNDSFGHAAGDEVLRESAARIARCVRASDTVARLGGDEFTVLLTSLNAPEEAWSVAEAILEALSREFLVAGRQCFLSASVGIATFPADGPTAGDLLKSADTAMYRAKAAGRAQIVFFEERMNAEAMLRMTLDNDLRMAIERGELLLHYQPIMDLATRRTVAAEALLRWRHPTRGLISPTRFIPLAEESGFIEQIGRWTLRQASLQASRWRAEGLMVEYVSVNVSPRQFRKGDLAHVVGEALAEASLAAPCLQVEITEGLLVDRGEAVEAMLQDLAARGHPIALDDFGTGFSSMAYLKRLPVHTIKIDRVFVDGLEKSPDSQAIVAAIIALSHALGKKVIAEGVETGEQLAILRRLGCDAVQGFLVAEALPAAAFAALVKGNRSAPLLA